MPRKFGRVTRLATHTALAVGALVAAPGAASAATCPFGPTSQAFSRWGDLDQYYTDSTSESVSASAHTSWAPSEIVDLRTGNLQPGQTGYARVTFASRGDWLIDGVHVDPRASR